MKKINDFQKLKNMIKQLFLIIGLLFLSIPTYSQNQFANFKIVNDQIIWQKVYEDSLTIKSQDIKLKAIGLPVMTTTFFISDITGAKLKVDRKGKRTRLTVSDIYSISSIKLDFGEVEENVKPDYAEDIYLKKGKFKKLFLRKDGKLLNDIIVRAIKTLLDENNDNKW